MWPEEERAEDGHVRRLGVDGDPADERGQVIRSVRQEEAAQPAGRGTRRWRAGLLAPAFIKPKEERREHQREIEEVGRDPEVIDPNHGSEEKGQDPEQRQGGGVGQAEIGIAHEQDEKQEDGVEDKGAVRPENADERRREQGVGHVLGVVKLLSVPLLDPLQEDAQRAGREILVVPEEILPGVFEVAVEGDALGHGVVGGLVAGQISPDVFRRGIVEDGQVEKKRDAQEEQRHQRERRRRPLPIL